MIDLKMFDLSINYWGESYISMRIKFSQRYIDIILKNISYMNIEQINFISVGFNTVTTSYFLDTFDVRHNIVFSVSSHDLYDIIFSSKERANNNISERLKSGLFYYKDSDTLELETLVVNVIYSI